MIHPESQNEVIQIVDIQAEIIDTSPIQQSKPIVILIKLSRAAVMAIAVAGAFWATEAHAEGPKDQTALNQAVKANDAFKVMQELIKLSGEGYRFAGLQQDGKVVQCGIGDNFMDAQKIGETKVREILKGDIDLSALIKILDNKKWVVCATGSVKVDPFEPELLSAPPLKPLPDPKVEIFKAMGELTREFGSQYRFAGKQKDGVVIQCANGKKLKIVKEEAKKQVKALLPNTRRVEYLSYKLKNGQWIVAALGRPVEVHDKGLELAMGFVNNNRKKAIQSLIYQLNPEYDPNIAEQHDGSVIGCAYGKEQKETKNKSVQKVRSIMGKRHVYMHGVGGKMANREWVTCSQGIPLFQHPNAEAKYDPKKIPPYMTKNEYEVIYWLNEVRKNPLKFAETFLKNQKGSWAKECYEEMLKTKPMQILIPSEALYKSAAWWAEEGGKKGATYHHNIERIWSYGGQGEVSENIEYGLSYPVEIVIDLLIDEGIEDRGHRKNILTPLWACVGVSNRPHIRYKINSVHNFSERCKESQ